MQNQNRKWSREETILAFELYCRTPYGRINSSNKEINELAVLLGRTTSAVVMKMVNLGSFDPRQRERNVSGLKNASKQDELVFNEFYKDLEKLSYNASNIRKEYGQVIPEEELLLNDYMLQIPGRYKEQSVKVRIGQSFFRKAVLDAYDNKCCITGISNTKLLIASHIKPWSESDNGIERTNPCNGLCLNALHDRAFDQGLLTIDYNYRIILSSKIKTVDMNIETKDWFLSFAGKQISLPDRFLPAKEIIKYHNENIFEP